MHFHERETRRKKPALNGERVIRRHLVFVHPQRISLIVQHMSILINMVSHLILDLADSAIVQLVMALVELNIQTLVELVLIASSRH